MGLNYVWIVNECRWCRGCSSVIDVLISVPVVKLSMLGLAPAQRVERPENAPVVHQSRKIVENAIDARMPICARAVVRNKMAMRPAFNAVANAPVAKSNLKNIPPAINARWPRNASTANAAIMCKTYAADNATPAIK